MALSREKAKASDLRRSLDWGSLAPLRIRARMVAEGVYAGAHRSARKGAGVELNLDLVLGLRTTSSPFRRQPR